MIEALIALAAIIVLGRLLSKILAYMGQPPVIGEVLAGILLGPSFIGPERSAYILAPEAAPTLSAIAQAGVVLYMFIVGVELDLGLLARGARVALATAAGSMLAPFALGVALATMLPAGLAMDGVSATSLALFMGVAMSITAFPVLARILTDSRMSRSDLGVTALTAAAIGDVIAWCLLAIVVGIATARPGRGLVVVLGAAAFIAIIFTLVRPVLSRVVTRASEARGLWLTVAVLLAAMAVSAFVTETIGIHAIFGAFLLGAVVPHDTDAARALSGTFQRGVTLLLLPAFFAFTGMRTRIDLVSGPADWTICLLIIVLATVGKVGGAFAAARMTGLGTREASILGVLMNTRGLMELIVLNVGLELGIIAPRLHAMMVVMALVTTAMTTPLLDRLRRREAP